jgi:DNA polymerase III alpha subunit
MSLRFKNFVSCHVHPNSLDSGSTPEAFAEREAELETGAITCTDHGTLQSARKIYDLGKEKGLIPLVGIEAYFRDDECSILTANGYEKNERGGFISAPKYSHITLHALDYAAYRCMVRLISRADLRLEADKERMEPAHRKMGSERKALFRWADLEELGTHNVTATSGCMTGICKRHIFDNDDPKTAIQYFERLKSTFKPGNFYVELNPHDTSHDWIQGVFLTMIDGTVHKVHDGKIVMTDAGEIRAGQLAKEWTFGKHHVLKSIKDRSKWREMPETQIVKVEEREGFERNECRPWAPDGNYEAALNRFMFILAKKHKVPVTLGDDSHYSTPDAAIVQDVRLSQKGPWRFYTGGKHNTYHRMTSDEAWTHFQSMPGVGEKEFESWIANSHDLASRFKDFKFESVPSLPTKFYEAEYQKRPWYVPGKASNSVQYTMELIRKQGRMKWDSSKYIGRLRQEIDLLHSNGTIDLLPYFMIDEDVCALYEKAEELTGPGRGSAAGALISYLLGITHVDPLKYDLSLDRFLTKDRINSGKWPDIDQDLSSRDLLTGGEVRYVEIELEDGTTKIMRAKAKVVTDEGEVTVQEAFDRGLDVRSWT